MLIDRLKQFQYFSLDEAKKKKYIDTCFCPCGLKLSYGHAKKTVSIF